ncbi:MAG: hypothetical protein ACC682_02195 [Gemmatimonadota bacterium]
MSNATPFDPERLITALDAHGVRYVLIGALAARLQGFPRVTADADITPARDPENLARLADALRDLGARVYTESVPEGLPYDWDARALGRGEMWNLITEAGRLDLIFSPAGGLDFDALLPAAVEFEVYGTTLHAADLSDIMRLKEAADRPQDRQDVVVLREMIRRREDHSPG